MLERGLLDTAESLKCSLREIKEFDIPSIQRIISKPKVMRYIDGLKTFEKREDLLRFFLQVSEISSKFATTYLYTIDDEESNMIGGCWS